MVKMRSSKGPPPLDLHFTHNPEVTYNNFDAMTLEQQKKYMRGELTTDIIYPIIYTLFFTFTLLLLYGANGIIPLIPYGAFIFDILENLSLFTLLKLYPEQINWLAWTSSVFSTLKWLFVLISFLLVIIGLFRKFIFKPDMK